MGSLGFKQVGDILRDVGNMKQNVENMEKQLNGSGKFKNEMEFHFAEKSSQTEFSVEDVKSEEAEVRKENYDNPKEVKVDEEAEIMK